MCLKLDFNFDFIFLLLRCYYYLRIFSLNIRAKINKYIQALNTDSVKLNVFLFVLVYEWIELPRWRCRIIDVCALYAIFNKLNVIGFRYTSSIFLLHFNFVIPIFVNFIQISAFTNAFNSTAYSSKLGC